MDCVIKGYSLKTDCTPVKYSINSTIGSRRSVLIGYQCTVYMPTRWATNWNVKGWKYCSLTILR